MQLPRFFHLTGNPMWMRCEHRLTDLHEETATVRLTTAEAADIGDGPFDPGLGRAWLERRGGAMAVVCRPAACEKSVPLLADPVGRFFALQNGVWVSLDPGGNDVTGSSATDLVFRPAPQSSRPSSPRRFRALDRDPFGRLWLLETDARRTLIHLLAATGLRVIATVSPPAGSAFIHLACCRWGVVAADERNRRIWRQAYGGEWEIVEIDHPDGGAAAAHVRGAAGMRPVACAGQAGERTVVLLWPETDASGKRSYLAVVERRATLLYEVPALETPLPILLLSDEYVLIGEVARSPGGGEAPMVFFRFRLGSDRLEITDTWAVRGFDGRAVFVDADGRPQATTSKGARPIYRRTSALVTAGTVETFAFDCGVYGNVWHRVFIDACIPDGTSVGLAARTADDLPPPALRRYPPGGNAEGGAMEEAWRQLPLGSRSPEDTEGWQPIEPLDRRAAHADLPLPPRTPEDLPSEDPCALRARLPEPVTLVTLEGLIRNAPGRYLWLRIELRGTARRTPAVRAVRATFPRPSLLDHLPSYWRAESTAAEAMEHALCLFEGLYTEIDQRIGAIRRLLDPRVCPAEMVAFLAGFVALTFDQRLRIAVRRQLLEEATTLYRQRGTVPGLERLCAILGECRVHVVERFRQRRVVPAQIGAKAHGVPDAVSGVVGPGLQISRGGIEIRGDDLEPWEAKLLDHRAQLEERRRLQELSGESPCPPGDLPVALDPAPLIAFYRRYAHRFTLLLFRPRDPTLEAVIEQAIAGSKPAHTLHEICWLDSDFRVGANTYVGIGTRLLDVPGLAPAVLGTSLLGMNRTLGFVTAEDRLGTRVGDSRVGYTSNLG